MTSWRPFRNAAFAVAVAIAFLPGRAQADHTPTPTTVTLPGNFQTELGCPGDWDPTCANSALAYDVGTDTWTGNFTIPAGNWEYKVAINGAWDENYGAGGVPGGANLSLSLVSEQNVTFVYSHHTHVVTQSVSPIVVAAGSFQSEVGCPGDWMPDCLNSQLFDADADGVFQYTTTALVAGSYEFKIALGLGWTVNYGEGGAPNGPNILFVVPQDGAMVTISWDSTTLIPTVTIDNPTPAKPASWGRLKATYR